MAYITDLSKRGMEMTGMVGQIEKLKTVRHCKGNSLIYSHMICKALKLRDMRRLYIILNIQQEFVFRINCLLEFSWL